MTLEDKFRRDIKPETETKTKNCPHQTQIDPLQGHLVKVLCDGSDCMYWSRTGGSNGDPSGVCTW